jgi:preprotein translocase subunit SecF
MELFRDLNIDFMKYRKYWVLLSLGLLALSVVAIFVQGKLNMGIDFVGGTQLTVQFRERPEIEALRQAVAAAGIPDAQIQRFGEEDSNEVMIKTPVLDESQEGSRERVVEALEGLLDSAASNSFDLNRNGRTALSSFLQSRDPDAVGAGEASEIEAHYERVAGAIIGAREEEGLLTSWERLRGLDAVSPEVSSLLESEAHLGPLAVLGTENVGPQIGRELRRKGILAVVLSLVGMLVYIWVRFELRFGIGAVVASFHDVMITLGFYALAGLEFNLTTIAAFLTLVGYSVNDTVVVFDRVRENMRRKRTEPLVDVINRSLNQTMSRTVLTSGTTLLAVGSLLVIGGDVLRGFAFILTIGIVVGTYSSIYIAGPFAILWEEYLGRDARLKRKEAKAA